jgi:hypothetical protein
MYNIKGRQARTPRPMSVILMTGAPMTENDERAQSGDSPGQGFMVESLAVLTTNELCDRWKTNQDTIERIVIQYEVLIERYPGALFGNWSDETLYGRSFKIYDRSPNSGVYGKLLQPPLPESARFRLSDVRGFEKYLKEHPGLPEKLGLTLPPSAQEPNKTVSAQVPEDTVSTLKRPRFTRKGQRDKAYPEVRKICLSRLRADKKKGKPYSSAPDLRGRVLARKRKGALEGLEVPSESSFYRWRQEWIAEIDSNIAISHNTNEIG